MIKLLTKTLIGVLFLTLFISCDKNSSLVEPDATQLFKQGPVDPVQGDIYAGQHELVGTFYAELSGDGNTLTVKYVIDSPWEMGLAHLYVDCVPPETSAPGQFPYHGTEADFVANTWEVEIDVSGCEDIWIAAHAEVCITEGGMENVEADLPEWVYESIEKIMIGGVGANGFWTTITNGSGSLPDGVYMGYCVDLDAHIEPAVPLKAYVHSSYSAEGEAAVDNPDNLDLINWIINQDYESKVSVCDGTAFTKNDIQNAIWYLMDQFDPTPVFDRCHVNEIINDAIANGDGFVPGCDQYLVIILIPDPYQDKPQQVNIVWIPVPCEEGRCETAWAYGYFNAPERNPNLNWLNNKGNVIGWGWYFQYNGLVD